jgi:phosphatidylglycerol:prolipoprotein diacylglycerol transferase
MHPFLLRFGHLGLPTFGVLAAVGLVLGLTLSERTARRAGVNPDKLWDAGLFLVLAAFVFSRLLLIVTHFKTFLTFPMLLLAVPSLTSLGVLFTVLAGFVWLRGHGLDLRRSLEAWAPCGVLVWSFLALGHFAEGSDPGLPASVPWGVRMPGESVPLHPVALYACLFAAGISWWVYRRVGHGDASAVALLGAGLGQYLLSFVRQPGVTALAGLDALQWVALGMVLAGSVLWLLRPPHAVRQGTEQAGQVE